MYEVYATRWDDSHIVEEMVPARGLQFSLPLSDHGEASFSGTVEPGRSFWRPALSCAMSGILICEDGVPVWAGQVGPEKQSGPRTFEFKASEWGSFFQTCPAVPLVVAGTNDHVIQRRLISDAQAIAGQDAGIILGASLGAAVSDLTINAWDSTSVEEEFRRLGEADGGPEWYVAATGTLENPTRTLVQGDRLGATSPVAVLEYVEDTGDGQRGGNVLSHPGRAQSPGFTVALAIGAGEQAAQLRRSATATQLLTAGYPRRTLTRSYTDASLANTLQRHANADLQAAKGMTTSYSFATRGDTPEWTSIARGDTVRVELDTDVYGGSSPLVFQTRVLDMKVTVPSEGHAFVDYLCSDVRET